ncbi:MAG: hypothetical protein JO316_06435 [Abitibacteriaceae bacterium]|nr:hypothetical protein [Abditibacteriaceae bacterium]
MRSPTWSRYSLFVLAALVLLLSASLWKVRRQRRQIAHIQSSSLTQRQNSQRAVALLFQALWADNHQTYTATTKTMAVYGNDKINTVAAMTHVPQGFAIKYLSGDPRGISSGFNQRWAWRKESAESPMTAYAATQRNATEMTAERFAMMLENYGAQWTGREKIGDRLADVVWILPFRSIDGARGPAKCLWIDRQTRLTLRVETFNYQMRPVMDSTLSQIDFHPKISEAELPPALKIAQVAKNSPGMAQDMGSDIQGVIAKTGGLAPPEPKELPPGFERESVGIHRTSETGASPPAALSRYTDGLNTLTLFAIKQTATPKAEPVKSGTDKSSSGVQMCDFGPGTLVMRDSGSVRLVAVADLPPQTLCRVLGVSPTEAINAACPPSPPVGH